MPRLLVFVLLLPALLPACSPGGPGEDAARPAPPPPDPETWWTDATRLPSGRERILAPRELRALLAEGTAYGFDADAEWWAERRRWVFDRVLQLDPLDVEANEALGRRTLRRLVDDFPALWERIQLAPVRSDAIDELLDRYDDRLLDGRPIFLVRDEAEHALALLREARRHLERLEEDPRYGAGQRALARLRNSVLGDYPFVHRFEGPFLVCLTARDLQRIPGEDPDAEQARLEAARALYERRLERRAPTWEGLLADTRARYPTLVARHPVGDTAVLVQWIFGDRAMFGDFLARARLDDPPVDAYRCGFRHHASGVAYLFEPPLGDATGEEEERAAEQRAERRVRETAAYLGAQQLLHHWATDPDDPLVDHLERSRAYWLKVGWPAWMAARRVEESPVGDLLDAARDAGTALPRLADVVARRGRLDPFPPLEPGGFVRSPPEGGDGFVDLAWALVAHLNTETYHAAFERYLISQVEGGRREISWFEECFGIEDAGEWRELQRAAYREPGDDG